MKVTGLRITSCPVDIGELSLYANLYLLSTRAFHLSSRVLENSIISNRNSTWDMLSTCLTPALNSMDVLILTVMILTKLLSYMRLISEHSFGESHIFPVWI